MDLDFEGPHGTARLAAATRPDGREGPVPRVSRVSLWVGGGPRGEGGMACAARGGGGGRRCASWVEGLGTGEGGCAEGLRRAWGGPCGRPSDGPAEVLWRTFCGDRRAHCTAPTTSVCERGAGGGRGFGTQKFVYQKWPKSILPFVSFSVSHSELEVRGGGYPTSCGCQPF